MALTFREQIEATAWELGNGEGTMPELRKRFDADPETPPSTGCSRASGSATAPDATTGTSTPASDHTGR